MPHTSAQTKPGAASTPWWVNYRQMHIRLENRVGRMLAEKAGLSQADLQILYALSGHPDDVIRDRTLRNLIEWEKSRLSHQLRRMEARGLVARGACIEDNRASMVSLTAAGKDAAIRGKQIEDEAVEHYVMSALTEEQLQQLSDIADAILRHTDASDPCPE
ncbi:MarR family winged helix-turn-helix transcriptional regulator [Arthrobacter sp. TMN-37]